MSKLLSREENKFLKDWLFDFNSCLSTDDNIFLLFKDFVKKENEGRFVHLVDVWKQINLNPTYYESSLHNEKKFEIECRLKQDAFPRFIRSNTFQQYITQKKNQLMNSGDDKQTSNISSTSTFNIPEIRPSIEGTAGGDIAKTDSNEENEDEEEEDESTTSSEDYSSSTNTNTSSLIDYQTTLPQQVSSYLFSIGTPCALSKVLSKLIFPYQLKDFQSPSLTFDDLNFMENLALDNPHWNYTSHIPASETTITAYKSQVKKEVHKQFLQNGGGDVNLATGHCKYLRGLYAKTKSTSDLPLEKVLTFKLTMYLPYSHHDVFHAMETREGKKRYDPQSNVQKSGNELFKPINNKESEKECDEKRDFYCYSEKILIPTFKLSSNRYLSLMSTNFYDTNKQQYVILAKSRGFDEDGTNSKEEGNSYGIKLITYTKVTNNLTKFEECGVLYMGGMFSKQSIAVLLFKDRLKGLYGNVINVMEEAKKNKFPKMTFESDGYRTVVLDENDENIVKYRKNL
ncbi:hypothetical protein ABK040_011059 [Willaertia magna]